MPAFNAEAFVGEAIDSVLGQTYPHVELIVVDDGSTDGTAGVVQRYGSRVRYFRQVNARQAAARNTGIRHVQGEYVAFLDADDVWAPDKLEKQMRRLLGEQGLGFVYCSIEQVDASGRRLGYRRGKRGRIAADLLLGETIGGVCGSTPLVSRARLDEVGDFDAALPPCEDTDFFVRVACRYPVDFVDEPLVKHRIHGGNSHKNAALMAPAWKKLYAKAMRNPSVADGRPFFRARCYGRLNYVLAGEHWWAGRRLAALGYGAASIVAWPPRAVALVRALARRLLGESR